MIERFPMRPMPSGGSRTSKLTRIEHNSWVVGCAGSKLLDVPAASYFLSAREILPAKYDNCFGESRLLILGYLLSGTIGLDLDFHHLFFLDKRTHNDLVHRLRNLFGRFVPVIIVNLL